MKSLEVYVSEFTKHVGNAIVCIQHAAENYAEACKLFPESAQKAFEEAYPHVTPNTWAKFLAVGNGDLNPSALLLSDRFCAKVARMPRYKQDETLNGDSFVVFNPTTREAEKLNYGSIKKRHEDIIFDETRNCVRTIPEQVAYCDLVAKQKMLAKRKYTVHTDRLEVHCACDIGKGELESILGEME